MSSSSTLDPKTRFHYQFQHAFSTITSQIQGLTSLSSSPSIGELRDAIDHILASISRLSMSVSDAGADNTLPAHDQKVYVDGVKALRDQLDEIRAKVEPKQVKRFAFKRRTTPSAGTTTTTTTTTTTDSRKLGSVGNTDQVVEVPKVEEEKKKVEGSDYNAELRGRERTSTVRRPSFSSAESIVITAQQDVHIVLPEAASHATAAGGQFTDLKGCVIDCLAVTGVTPFANLAVKKVVNTLIVAGRVDGSVHVTGVKNSVIFVAARQVRMHDCEGCDVYLSVKSHPIIEGCVGMRFGPWEFDGEENNTENKWEKVDDFNWLKEGVKSPNWGIIPCRERICGKEWERDGRDDGGRAEILRRVGVGRKRGVEFVDEKGEVVGFWVKGKKKSG
ncbi:tubulin-specific chaperone C [Podospora fimiseda]|uniref:Tubulin-specific chaperone C n=1 Tax=Podospora fimiseda TaxID=252190 RepID=A0AAN7BNL9_9PEZI|nr:tubulin-specific chaperone C [Podospora fimiseda]